MKVSWLNLHRWIPQKDVRKLIYARLNYIDRLLVMVAHDTRLTLTLSLDFAKHCAAGGYIDLYVWAGLPCYDTPNFLVGVAAENGQFEMVKWFLNRNDLTLELGWIKTAALKSNHREMIFWIHDNICNRFDSSFTGTAVKYGHFDLFLWGIINKAIYSYNILKYCAKWGNIDMIKFVRKNCQMPLDPTVLSHAAKYGHMQTLEYLISEHCPQDTWTCARAAQGGHLNILKWLRERGFPWNETTCEYAADKGHLEILQYARSEGCHWDEDTTWCAADSGHFETFKWAVENGCPVEWSLAAYLIKRTGRVHIFKWLVENDCNWNYEECLKEAKSTTLKQWIRSKRRSNRKIRKIDDDDDSI